MITDQQIKELEKLIENFDLSVVSFPYKVRPGETLQTLKDAAAFIDSSYETIVHNRKSKWFVPYYERLRDFLTQKPFAN